MLKVRVIFVTHLCVEGYDGHPPVRVLCFHLLQLCVHCRLHGLQSGHIRDVALLSWHVLVLTVLIQLLEAVQAISTHTDLTRNLS